jgi:hypothetical protein
MNKRFIALSCPDLPTQSELCCMPLLGRPVCGKAPTPRAATFAAYRPLHRKEKKTKSRRSFTPRLRISYTQEVTLLGSALFAKGRTIRHG